MLIVKCSNIVFVYIKLSIRDLTTLKNAKMFKAFL